MQFRYGFVPTLVLLLVVVVGTRAQNQYPVSRSGADAGGRNYPPVPPPQSIDPLALPPLTLPPNDHAIPAKAEGTQQIVLEIPSLVEPYRVPAPPEQPPANYLPPAGPAPTVIRPLQSREPQRPTHSPPPVEPQRPVYSPPPVEPQRPMYSPPAASTPQVASTPPLVEPQRPATSSPPPATFPALPTLNDANARTNQNHVGVETGNPASLPPMSPSLAPMPAPSGASAPPAAAFPTSLPPAWPANAPAPALPGAPCQPNSACQTPTPQTRIAEVVSDYQYPWQALPLMLGDFGDPNPRLKYATDITNIHPRDSFDLRTANANVGGDSINQLAGSAEITGQGGLNSVGIVGGVQTATGSSTALAPAIYGKQLFRVSEQGYFGGAMGLSVPIGRRDLSGGLSPWAFYGREIGGGAWFRGLTGLNIPFSNANTCGIFLDHGILVPLQPLSRNPIDDRFQTFLTAELHANYAFRQGNGFGPVGFGGTSLIVNNFGRSDFNLNTTLGGIVRKNRVDLYFGLAFPLLSDRVYDYEVITRIGYRF